MFIGSINFLMTENNSVNTAGGLVVRVFLIVIVFGHTLTHYTIIIRLYIIIIMSSV